MRSYFHCSTSKFRRRKAVVLTLAGSVCAEAAVISFIVMFFGLFGSESANDALAQTAFLIAALFTALGMTVCFTAAAVLDKRSARHSRYTYLDIQLKCAVISVYSGEMRILGRSAVFRELYLIPFKELESVSPSRNGRRLVIRGKLRRYGMESDFLGYHVRGGDVEFDRMWLNVGSFEELHAAELPAYFGDAGKICSAIADAKKRFDEIPRPKKHEFREADFIRRRPRPRMMPDDLNFSRTWK